MVFAPETLAVKSVGASGEVTVVVAPVVALAIFEGGLGPRTFTALTR